MIKSVACFVFELKCFFRTTKPIVIYQKQMNKFGEVKSSGSKPCMKKEVVSVFLSCSSNAITCFVYVIAINLCRLVTIYAMTNIF